MNNNKNRKKIFFAALLVAIIGTVAWGILFANTGEIDNRRAILEWRLPAQLELMWIDSEFLSRTLLLGKPTENGQRDISDQKKQLEDEKRRAVSHLMNLHGFDKHDFGSFKHQSQDKELMKLLIEADPALSRKIQRILLKQQLDAYNRDPNLMSQFLRDNAAAIQSLKDKMNSSSNPDSKKNLEWLEQMTTKGSQIKEVPPEKREQVRQKLLKLDQEEEQWKFPYPTEEQQVFSVLQLAWWDIKGKFIRQYHQLLTNSSSYNRKRWDLVQEYRAQLQSLMRTHRVQPAHFDEYNNRQPSSLASYVQQHSKYQKNWHALNSSLKKEIPGFSLENSNGMGMIVGTVIECAVPPVRCRGADKAKGVPLAGFPVTLETEGDDPRNPKGFFFKGKSNEQGQFLIPAVPPGEYVLYASQVLPKEKIEYRGNGRKFFVQGNHEVLILDMLVQEVALIFRPVEQ